MTIADKEVLEERLKMESPETTKMKTRANRVLHTPGKTIDDGLNRVLHITGEDDRRCLPRPRETCTTGATGRERVVRGGHRERA